MAVIRCTYNSNEPSADIKFEKVFRAKLHKKEQYGDEAWGDYWLGRAAELIRVLYRPGCERKHAERHYGMSHEMARGILDAYQEASGGAQ